MGWLTRGAGGRQAVYRQATTGQIKPETSVLLFKRTRTWTNYSLGDAFNWFVWSVRGIINRIVPWRGIAVRVTALITLIPEAFRCYFAHAPHAILRFARVVFGDSEIRCFLSFLSCFSCYMEI